MRLMYEAMLLDQMANILMPEASQA
jgi:hypothetical protein